MKRIMWWKNRGYAGFEWSEKYSVGNAILDSEHRNLMEKINNIMRLLENNDCVALSEAFSQLESWLKVHFENEKLFAQSLDIDFELHELAHERLLEEIHSLQDNLLLQRLKDSSCKSEGYRRFLHNWLIGHITEHDMQMKQHLQCCKHDYIPPSPLPSKT